MCATHGAGGAWFERSDGHHERDPRRAAVAAAPRSWRKLGRREIYALRRQVAEDPSSLPILTAEQIVQVADFMRSPGLRAFYDDELAEGEARAAVARFVTGQVGTSELRRDLLRVALLVPDHVRPEIWPRLSPRYRPE